MQVPYNGQHGAFLKRVFVGTFLFSIFFCCPRQIHHPVPGLTIDSAHAEEHSSVAGVLTVFAAASLTEPFTEIAEQLKKKHPTLEIIFNFGGSQALRTQLEQGAHADVFASADTVQMELAKKSDVVQGETPFFVKNRLVVIMPRDNPGQVREFRDLAKPGLKLDLANANVPAGRYSRLAFNKANADYSETFVQAVLHNLVSEEENVKQVVTKVQLGEVDAGVVYVTDVTPKVRAAIQTISIPDAYNQVAAYPIAVTREVRNPQAAEAFSSFVFSHAGQEILQAHGFLPFDH